ncbi:hypothetical protein IT882_13165 [Microbacterium schleiferi]|uniref:Uncharacterized protein n=1 Tax=Microbacterium schleiferi TaxID=69362 RepID=A0A7S8RGI6_9MICO|nr:hypothetical protein [Microbacterium schleiferi]QPE04141.1 hypothetical protein IT882_13165 [Microbacterium schleiferi]
MIANLRAWLTDDRRQALHAALGTLAAFAVAAGWLNGNQEEVVVGLIGSLLALVQGLLSLSLLSSSGKARWFSTVGRGLIYGAAAAAGAAGVGFGLFGADVVEYWLGLLTVALTVVSSFLAVVNVQTTDAAPSDARQTLNPRLEP